MPWWIETDRKRKPSTATIEIRTASPPESESWRIAILSFDTSTDANFIAPNVAAELGLTVHPLDKESPNLNSQFNGREITVKGYVDTLWTVQNSRRTHTSRFLVTASTDPPFDVVLGREGIAQHKLGHGILRGPWRF